MNFKYLNSESINVKQGLNQLQQKGSLVYEYNPLRVMRINEDTIINDIEYPKGSLVDLDTELLQFDLNHPIDIVTQQSYDGSTNLIINDGQNNPKLINTRFSPTGLDTYQIVDREGDNDTNIYDVNTFSSDTSLYKKVNTLVKLRFIGEGTDGNLKVGNYVFYFKLSDSDGNETDFIAESRIVTCYIGNLNDPASIQGGIRDENSYKSVTFNIQNIDSSYNNVVVYYTRSTSDIDGNEITTSYKVLKQFSVYNGVANIHITGFENTQEVSINDINVQYNVINNAKAQTTCQNMLFLGNVEKTDIPYKELSDLSLRFLPYLNTSHNIGFVNENYVDESGKYEYYNIQNIYNKLGYWNEEIYRFGIVYIMNDFTLSPVFNIRGIYELTENPQYQTYKLYNDQGEREYIPINKETNLLDNQNENSKGVIKIKYSGNQLDKSGVVPIGLNFKVQSGVVELLKKYTKGFFFVRQKRIPTTLCQAVTIGLETTSHLPVIPVGNNKYIIERFLDNDRTLTHDFDRRKVELDTVDPGYAAICPEYEQRQATFNQLFTGTQFIVEFAKSQFRNKYFDNITTHFYNLDYISSEYSRDEQYYIMAVSDNNKLVKNKKILYSARAGEAEEAYRVSYIKYTNKSNQATNVVRGSFGPYLGLEGYNTSDMSLINIKIPGYSEASISSYFGIRYDDSSSFYAISDRYAWDDVESDEYIEDIFGGDCYIGNYTHRMCRNFQDPSAPINDDIIDSETWKDNYSLEELENNEKINRGDVNAVKIGHWVTIKLCSSINLSIRSVDKSYISEYGLTGRFRGFYPLQAMSTGGESKIPESFVRNAGFDSTTSDKYYFELPNVPAIKNKFHIRIMYSDINVNDSFKNGYRTFKLSNYYDYPLTYGSIVKLVEWFGNIICVFEHGVALIPVNERAVAGEGMGGNVFINTSNVLPKNPKMLSDTFGTQWSESVVKTPYYVYGVDTVGKKIWRTNGQTFEVISDFKVQKFLNDNISITEKEKTPIIGIRNVKTHYNRFKHDVMFTFYDDINTLEENVWNLCYNEIMQRFITFYSWVPSYSENIDNIFFSFDRDTSKTITKLTSNYPLISLQGGCIVNDSLSATEGKATLGSLQLNLDLEGASVEYTIADERVRNKFFINNNSIIQVNENALRDKRWTIPIKAVIYNQGTDLVEGEVKNIVKTVYSNITVVTQSEYNLLTTSFWKHGKAGLMQTKEPLSPCYWYGKHHPFEFEFVVVDNPFIHKIFNNLKIISNKAQPESLHFEIVGEVYDFAKDKKNMYFRQEATKHLYQYNGADIVYDKKYLTVEPSQRDIPYSTLGYKDKSIMFPLYYSRVDSLNTIYDHYQSMTSIDKDYQYLSGSEIIYDDQLSEFRIATHIKGCPFEERYLQEITEEEYNYLVSSGYTNVYTKEGRWYEILEYGRINGNMNYQEDKWDIQIPSITYWSRNETAWTIKDSKGNSYPPLNLANNPLPESMKSLVINSDEDIPKELRDLGYQANYSSLEIEKWNSPRKETRIRDKYIKIKIRYSGNELAIIQALKTIYNISYA